MGRGTLHKTGRHASVVMGAWACGLWLVLSSACARVDVRQWLPSSAVRTDRLPSPRDVAVTTLPLSELPGPPALHGGAASLLLEPLGSLVASVPWLGSAGAPGTPPWFTRARRADPVTSAVVEGLLGPGTRWLPRSARRWALSDDAAAVMDGREAGVGAVLVVRASAGPDDAGEPLPGAVVVAAEAALLSTEDGSTLARAYERVSVTVGPGGEPAVTSALRRAASRVARGLGASMRLAGWPWQGEALGEGTARVAEENGEVE